MKKITFLLLLMASLSTSKAAIIVRDIPDFAFASNATLDFDFNNDGTAEFTFSEMDGSVGSTFNSDNVNFITFGTMDAGEGWDVIKPLTAGTNINSSGVYGALGDAYINPFWASANQMFPSGDSYIGTTFKIGTAKYYGWILVNFSNNVITVKKYAYNNVANQGLTAGQTSGIENNESEPMISIYPNPTQDQINFSQPEMVKNVIIYTTTGQKVFETNELQNNISINNFPSGVYLVNIETITGAQITKKIVKN
ncbi:MAG TPA: T9SS type A sorting domain-containing protein [Bacteroidales bacterium]|nr:T9SS type A sorting domain-containing protein [Bacteroidales bacterium]